MRLSSLTIENFRNLAAVQLSPALGLNIVFGDNASGKTSLLEAIHFLARVRSFRTTRPQQLIKQGCDALTVRAVAVADAAETRLAVRRSPTATDVRINGQDIRSLSALARHLPLQVVNSESQRLLLDGPAVRRSFLDWGLFHVEQDYYAHWKRYDRALRQRNRALRAGDERLARSWEPELEAQAVALTAHREAHVAVLAGLAAPLLERWLPDEPIALDYRRGWSAERTLAESFAAGRTREREQGHTLFGPHRADLLVRSAGMEAQHRLSRGQQKLVVIALLLASSQALHAAGDALLLVDDLPAELDEQHRAEVLQLLHGTGAQTFITATERAALPAVPSTAKWFHVEQGRYAEVV